jgi:hypothetical protein
MEKRDRNPDVQTLNNDPRYRKVLELEFNDMISFVLENIRKRGAISCLFAFLNGATLVFIVLYVAWNLINHQFAWSHVFWQTLMGIFAGSILIIPFHELLHGLAYWIIGARKIIFGADLQQFIFYVTADRYPISRGNLYLLAMTPFVIINTVSLILVIEWFPQYLLFAAWALLSHNIMCIGDFAIVNYALRAKKPLFTYDEPNNKRSYFYEEISDFS